MIVLLPLSVRMPEPFWLLMLYCAVALASPDPGSTLISESE